MYNMYVHEYDSTTDLNIASVNILNSKGWII